MAYLRNLKVFTIEWKIWELISIVMKMGSVSFVFWKIISNYIEKISGLFREKKRKEEKQNITLRNFFGSFVCLLTFKREKFWTIYIKSLITLLSFFEEEIISFFSSSLAKITPLVKERPVNWVQIYDTLTTKNTIFFHR